MPNVEAIRAWVEDLRTTNVSQGQKVLRHGGDCCLMRACVVYQRETGQGEPAGMGFKDGFGFRSDTALPQNVQRWFGFDSSNPVLLHRGNHVSCQNANDDLGLSFAQIADGLAAMYLE